MDCTWITAYRTGAASALSAKYLARPAKRGRRHPGVRRAGAHEPARAGGAVPPQARVRLRHPARRAAPLRGGNVGQDWALEIIGVDEPKKAVVESDLVVTSGPILKHPTPTIEKDWLRPGAFASAVDFDSLLASAKRWRSSTSSAPTITRSSSITRASATFRPRPTRTPTWARSWPDSSRGASATTSGRWAMNLGLALDDMAVAPEIYRRAKERGIGTWLTL